MADIFYTAPVIEGTPYEDIYRPDQPDRPRRRLRNWHKFCSTYSLVIAGLALLLRSLVLRTGGNQAGATAVVAGVALVALLAALLILYAAWRLERL